MTSCMCAMAIGFCEAMAEVMSRRVRIRVALDDDDFLINHGILTIAQ